MNQRQIRVALVDDSVPLRTALRELLEDEGFEVVGEAGDGYEGIELIKNEAPDAVVLDLAMPGLDGLQAIPKIREQSRDVKIIVLSLAGKSMQVDAYDAGADGYFGKGEPIQHVVIGLRSMFPSRS